MDATIGDPLLAASVERAFEKQPLPGLWEQVTPRAVVVSVVLSVVFGFVILKIHMSTGVVPGMNMAVSVLSFALLKCGVFADGQQGVAMELRRGSGLAMKLRRAMGRCCEAFIDDRHAAGGAELKLFVGGYQGAAVKHRQWSLVAAMEPAPRLHAAVKHRRSCNEALSEPVKL
ncbi:putative metal-nicotianamine transporter YSL3 [Hordeum vulgare]|nr:putative metal-nicotianamine transporter YSL3 [Hordeum vulgare]